MLPTSSPRYLQQQNPHALSHAPAAARSRSAGKTQILTPVVLYSQHVSHASRGVPRTWTSAPNSAAAAAVQYVSGVAVNAPASPANVSTSSLEGPQLTSVRVSSNSSLPAAYHGLQVGTSRPRSGSSGLAGPSRRPASFSPPLAPASAGNPPSFVIPRSDSETSAGGERGTVSESGGQQLPMYSRSSRRHAAPSQHTDGSDAPLSSSCIITLPLAGTPRPSNPSPLLRGARGPHDSQQSSGSVLPLNDSNPSMSALRHSSHGGCDRVRPRLEDSFISSDGTPVDILELPPRLPAECGDTTAEPLLRSVMALQFPIVPASLAALSRDAYESYHNGPPGGSLTDSTFLGSGHYSTVWKISAPAESLREWRNEAHCHTSATLLLKVASPPASNDLVRDDATDPGVGSKGHASDHEDKPHEADDLIPVPMKSYTRLPLPVLAALEYEIPDAVPVGAFKPPQVRTLPSTGNVMLAVKRAPVVDQWSADEAWHLRVVESVSPSAAIPYHGTFYHPDLHELWMVFDLAFFVLDDTGRQEFLIGPSQSRVLGAPVYWPTPEDLAYMSAPKISVLSPVTAIPDAYAHTALIPVSEAAVAYVLRQVLECLHLLHLHSWRVHLDVKPANMLLVKDACYASDPVWGNAELFGPLAGHRVSLCDYGCAMVIDSDVTTVGDVHYLAPESCDCKTPKHVCTSDSWCVGISALTLLDGAPPMFGWNPETIQIVIGTTVLQPQPRWPHACSQRLLSFISSCLTRSVAHRPSVEELCAHPFLTQYFPSAVESSPRFPASCK